MPAIVSWTISAYHRADAALTPGCAVLRISEQNVKISRVTENTAVW
jgi:hypothetical protein